MELANEKIVIVMRFFDINQAEMAAEILAQNEIRSGLIGANLFNTDYFVGLASNGIKLEVKESDAARAVEILKDCFDAQKSTVVALSPDDEPLEGQPQCPKCGSSDIAYDKYDRKSFFLTLVFIGFPVPLKSRRAECLSCGWSGKIPKKPK